MPIPHTRDENEYNYYWYLICIIYGYLIIDSLIVDTSIVYILIILTFDIRFFICLLLRLLSTIYYATIVLHVCQIYTLLQRLKHGMLCALVRIISHAYSFAPVMFADDSPHVRPNLKLHLPQKRKREAFLDVAAASSARIGTSS